MTSAAAHVDHADPYAAGRLCTEILDRLEVDAPPPFGWSERTGERSYWINAQGAPPDGYEAALDRLAPDWREHLARTP